jgi:hypothetical protein
MTQLKYLSGNYLPAIAGWRNGVLSLAFACNVGRVWAGIESVVSPDA